jgi:hypothetical protein
MGASQSYEKATSRTLSTNMLLSVDDLSTFLNSTTPVTEKTLSSSITSDTFNNLRATNVSDDNSEHNDNNKPNEIIDNEIIKDLEQKYSYQIAEIKKKNEYIDLLTHDLNVIKNKINKNNQINRNLLIFIIIFILIIIPVSFLIIVKFVKI